MSEPFLSDLERRAVAHLPRFREENATVTVDGEEVSYIEHVREANGYPDDWTPHTSATLDELHAALIKDVNAASPSREQLQEILAGLEGRGYVRSAGDAVAMTASGLEALQA